ncbi:hypothetical protein ACOMHN_062398 [Nucella lapillus]
MGTDVKPHCTNPLQSYYSPTPTTLLYNPLQPHCTNPLQSYYSPTPTTLLHNLQSHCTNRDPLQQHPYHESPDGSVQLQQNTNEDQPSHLPTCAPPGYSSF